MAKNNDVNAFERMFGNLDRIIDEHSQTAVAKEKITDDKSQKVVDIKKMPKLSKERV